MLDTAYSREYPSIYRGIVEDNNDPETLGRCRVRVPFIHGELSYSPSLLPWARPIVLSPVKEKRGSVNIPDIGDVVWVFFEGQQKDCPVYLGGTYAIGELEIDPNRVDFYVEEDTQISYNRSDKSYEIIVGDTSIKVNDSGISIVGDTRIEGNLSITGNLSVSGHTTLSNLTITGSCNKECKCNE